MERGFDLSLSIRNNLTFALSMPIIDNTLENKTRGSLTTAHPT